MTRSRHTNPRSSSFAETRCSARAIPFGSLIPFTSSRADGYVSQEISVMVSGASPSPTLEFVLPRSSVVTGRVVDRAGNTVPGAAVRIGYPGELRTFVFEQEVGPFRSDEFGYFVLPFVAQGKPFVIEATTTACGEATGLTNEEWQCWGKEHSCLWWRLWLSRRAKSFPRRVELSVSWPVFLTPVGSRCRAT